MMVLSYNCKHKLPGKDIGVSFEDSAQQGDIYDGVNIYGSISFRLFTTCTGIHAVVLHTGITCNCRDNMLIVYISSRKYRKNTYFDNTK